MLTGYHLSTEEKIQALKGIEEEVALCKKCPLAKTRTKIVFGEGNIDSGIILIAEAPGQTEDETGRPLVGRAGKALNEMLKEAGIQREDIYICNLIKCRPPENRNPEPEEINICKKYLLRQIDIINPKKIITTGKFSSQILLHSEDSIGFLRGKIFEKNNIKIMATYHPSYILRNNSKRDIVISDLKTIMEN